MVTLIADLSSLYKARATRVDIVDVPALGCLVVDGTGPPDGEAFAAAVQALYSVSYRAHFLVKKRDGHAPRVMSLETLWWVDDPRQRAILEAVAKGAATMTGTDRDRWQWRALIVQPDPIDATTVAVAIGQARASNDQPALRRVRYLRWCEGLSAQLLHVGPYAAEAPSIARLHAGIAAAGYRPRGRHHEIYLSDPRRTAPQRLRTILRQPVAPLST
jgi:hypothetical protein